MDFLNTHQFDYSLPVLVPLLFNSTIIKHHSNKHYQPQASMYSTFKTDFFKKITANMLDDIEGFIAESLQYFFPPPYYLTNM